IEIDQIETGLHLAEASPRDMKIVLVLDFTRSMQQAGALDAMEQAADRFIRNLRGAAQVAIYEFHRQDRAPGLVSGFTDDTDMLIERLYRARGQFVQGIYLSSRLWDATAYALAEFPDTNPNLEQRFVVLFTDGQDSSSFRTVNDLVDLASPDAADVRIYPIAFTDDPNRIDLMDLAARTEGTYYRSGDLSGVLDRFDQIMRDLSGQYTLRWQTLKRADTTYTPSFTISYDGKYVNSPTLNTFNPTALQDNLFVGRLRLTKPTLVDEPSVLRADYVPPYVNRFRIYIESDIEYRVSIPRDRGTPLTAGWELMEYKVPETGGRVYDIKGDDYLGFAKFGSVLEFQSSDPRTTMSFVNVYVDNSIYDIYLDENAGPVFALGESGDITWFSSYPPDSEMVTLDAFGIKQDWVPGRNPRVLADVNGDGRQDIVGFSDRGVEVGLSMISTLLPETTFQSTLVQWTLNADPHWAGTEPESGSEWEFGVPQGMGGGTYGNPDPTSGFTGSNVIGVNLRGNYSTAPGGPFYVMTDPINCSDFESINLRFKRWLNCDASNWAPHFIEVSIDGENWTSVWQNVDVVTDDRWTDVEYALPRMVDFEERVWIRWGYTIRANAFPYSGWNIDDILLYGETDQPRVITAPTLWVEQFGYDQFWREERHIRTMADVNGDGKADAVGFGDKGVVVALSEGQSFAAPGVWVKGLGYNDGWRVDQHPRFLEDVNGDGMADIVAFGNNGVVVATSWGAGFEPARLWIKDYFSAKGLDEVTDDPNEPLAFPEDRGNPAGRDDWRTDIHQRVLADVNGDGLNDIVGFHDIGVFVSYSTGNGFAEPIKPNKTFTAYRFNGNTNDWVQNWRNERHPRFAKDVGGPVSASNLPMADIIGFGDKGVYVALADGVGFATETRWISDFGGATGGWESSKHIRELAQINGDSFYDIFAIGNSPVIFSPSDGGGSFAPVIRDNTMYYDLGYNDGWDKRQHLRLVGDVDGDGLDDIVAIGYLGVQIFTNQ
ncbi:VWA domain-containing protein, partial [bacterium]|nr:VWA domain-containing protein [bacterium]